VEALRLLGSRLTTTAHALTDERSCGDVAAIELPLCCCGNLATTTWAISASKHHRLVRVEALRLLGSRLTTTAHALTDERSCGDVAAIELPLCCCGNLATTTWAISASKHHRLVWVEALRLLCRAISAEARAAAEISGGCDLHLRGHDLASAPRAVPASEHRRLVGVQALRFLCCRQNVPLAVTLLQGSHSDGGRRHATKAGKRRGPLCGPAGARRGGLCSTDRRLPHGPGRQSHT